MEETYFEIAYKRHLETLKNRVKSCTRDELELIADTIMELDPDILLATLHKKLKGDK